MYKYDLSLESGYCLAETKTDDALEMYGSLF